MRSGIELSQLLRIFLPTFAEKSYDDIFHDDRAKGHFTSIMPSHIYEKKNSVYK